jgi:thioredoxin 1
MASTLRSSLEAAEEVLDASCDLHGMPRAEAVVGGFSQGAALALAIALREGATRPAGVLSLSGFLPPEGVEYGWEGELPPVLMQHGTSDPLIDPARARESAQTLADHGVPLVYREFPMEHNVTLESVQDAAAWLSRVVAGERPSEELRIPEATAPADDGPVRTVTATTFDAEVLRSDKPVIVDFWAPWCQPCRAIAPIIEQIAVMRKDSYKVCKLNIDEAQDIAQRYGVQSIPLVGLFRNGRLERQSLGVKSRPQLEAELGMLVIP